MTIELEKEMKKKIKKDVETKVKYYSLLEQHNDGSWWYHRNTYTSRQEAEEALKRFCWFDEERKKMILEHNTEIPNIGLSLYTRDLKHFYRGGDNRTPVVTLWEKI